MEDQGFQAKTNAPKFGAFLPLLSKLAGEAPSVLNPLFADSISVGRQLEKFGFAYHRGFGSGIKLLMLMIGVLTLRRSENYWMMRARLTIVII